MVLTLYVHNSVVRLNSIKEPKPSPDHPYYYLGPFKILFILEKTIPVYDDALVSAAVNMSF